MGWQDRDYARHDMYGRPLPWRPATGSGMSMSTILIIINVAVFVIDAISHRALSDWGATDPERVMRGQVWLLLTSIYLHANPMHLFFNMLGLYFLGPYLEQAWGSRRFVVVYHACGLAGSLCYVILAQAGWLGFGDLIGASGAVLGVLAACAVLFPHIQLIVLLFPMRIRTAALLFMGLYVLNVLSRGVNAGGDAAHLGGLALGAAYAWYHSQARGGGRPARIVSIKKYEERPTEPVPGAWQKRLDEERQDEETVDRILAKIHEHGLDSLSAAEKEALASASRRQRAREEQFGRTDRL